MKTVFAMLMALSLIAGATTARADTVLPVVTVNGEGLVLRAVGAQLEDGRLRVSGWVRRAPGNYGPFNAHLHVDALGLEGQTLETLEARWSGILSSDLRRRRDAYFRVRFDQLDATAPVSVRVSIQPGRRH